MECCAKLHVCERSQSFPGVQNNTFVHFSLSANQGARSAPKGYEWFFGFGHFLFLILFLE